jgi:hypothetical protein
MNLPDSVDIAVRYLDLSSPKRLEGARLQACRSSRVRPALATEGAYFNVKGFLVPSGAKALFQNGVIGTAEAVPLQGRDEI